LLTRFPPIYLVTAAVLLGDAIGNCGRSVPFTLALILTVFAVVVCVARAPIAATVIALGAIVCAATIPAAGLLNPANGANSLHRFPDAAMVTVDGRIIRAPQHAGHGRTYLYVDVKAASPVSRRLRPATGRLRITVVGDSAFLVGEEIRASGRIRFPRNDGNPGEFDYRAYLLRHGVDATMFAGGGREKRGAIAVVGYHERFPYSELQRVRDRIGAFIAANTSGDERAEMLALVIGDRGEIDEQLRQLFARTGMAHLLVISGLHLGFLAAAAFFAVRILMGFTPSLMARGYANKIAAAVAAIAVVMYALIAGHHVSTIRALVMVLSYAFAVMIDRSREVLASLALAALVICIALPGSTADIGFQLSFVSVAVIILGMRRFTRWWRERYQPLGTIDRSRAMIAAEWIAGYVAVSFWAMVGTAPLTAYHFNQFSTVGLVANAVVVPLMGFGATVCALGAAALSFVYVPIARQLLIVAAHLAGVATSLTGWFARWPCAWVHVFTPTVLELFLVYTLLLLRLTKPTAGTDKADGGLLQSKTARDGFAPRSGGWRFSARKGGWRKLVFALTLTTIAADAGWWVRQRYFNPDLKITFLSVGEGDAAVVRFPGSRVMLIDGGGSFFSSFDPGERIVAPYLWSKRIMHVDYVALSHPDRDHFGGLIFIARNFAPSEFWTTGASSADTTYAELLAAMRAAGARWRLISAATPTFTVDGATVKCLGPPPDDVEKKQNNRSMVLRIKFGRASFLFTGDIEAKGERELVESGRNLQATVLKVPHHGSITSSTEAFVTAVHPDAAVISLGYRNQFHFPAPEVVERYEHEGVRVLRTDRDGAIMADDDGRQLLLTSYRRGPVVLPPESR
jgi:competence protein ComEC